MLRGLPFSAILVIILFSLPKIQAESASLDFLVRTLGESGSAVAASEGRLASGRELLTDNPANEAIYQALEKQVRALNAVLSNEADMVSYYRFQDSVLGHVLDSLGRIRELALRRGDPAFAADDRAIVDGEMDMEYEDILSTLDQADFNGNKPFSALASRPDLASWFDQKSYRRLDSIDALMAAMIRERSIVGAKEASLDFVRSGQEISRENKVAQQSLTDADIGLERSNLEREDLLFLVNLFLLK